MKSPMHVYYDKEGDFLEIGMGNPKKGRFKNLGKGVFERVDEENGKILGIAIMGFNKRTENLKPIEVSLPFKFDISS